MGIDWETLTGCDGEDLADLDCADDCFLRKEYSDKSNDDYYDECDYNWDDDTLEKFKVKISGNIVAYFGLGDDDYVFFCNDHLMSIESHIITVDAHSYRDYYCGCRDSKYNIDGNEFIEFERNGTKYISINGFRCEKPEVKNDMQSKKRYEELLSEFGKSFKIDEYDLEDYSAVFDSKISYDKKIEEADYDYLVEKFYEHTADDGKKTVYYDGNICLEYTDKDGKKILFIGGYDCAGDYFSGYVLVEYTDENGKPVVEINGNGLSEYNENGRHIVRINGYELVTYEENGETVGFINGVKCETAM